MYRLAIMALALTLASASLEANWAVYKKTHKKIYSEDEDAARRLIWQTNLRMIEEHNELYAQGLSSFYLGENHFTDMTTEEFNNQMKGLKINKDLKINKPLNRATFRAKPHLDELPDQVDWRTKGYVTSVKDQGQCGSCWAFSTTGSLEGQHFKATGKLVSLSESNLVDCARFGGNDGCRGGNVDTAFQYIISNKGIDTEAGYPYIPRNGICNFNRTNIGATIKSYTDVEAADEDALKQAVAEIGPISVSIDANTTSFRFYNGGVLDDSKCSSTDLDHAVLIVGYGTQEGTDYWIVKNSWGSNWGDHGYILMARNKNNQCGIATAATYPIV
ncbi:hypothetical protein BsWGS_19193 [Bradybaena similaris]